MDGIIVEAILWRKTIGIAPAQLSDFRVFRQTYAQVWEMYN